MTKSSDSKVIYVSSSSGSDSNSGTTADRPVRSISKGMSLMRSGMPDHLLLKRGDSWTENLSWGKSGRSSQEPAYFGAYGSGARPMIKAGSKTAIDISGSNVNHLVIQSIHLFAHTRDPNASGFSRSEGEYGIRWVAGSSGALIEDTVIDQFRFNILLQPYNSSQSNIKLRRSIITDAYSTGGHSSGMYAQGVNGLTLEDNVFDHNGWHESVSGAGATSQNHNAYVSEKNSNVFVRGNIFANGSSHGLQMRAGGEVWGNLFLRNPIHMSFGLVNGAPLKSGGVTGTIDGNVFMESRSIGSSPRGWAIELGNIKSATVRNNIMSDDSNGASGAFSLGTGSNLENASQGVGINNLLIENNIVNKWYMGFQMSGSIDVGGSGYKSLNNMTVRNNDFQNVDGPYNRIVAHSSSMSTSDEFWSNNRYYENADNSKWYFVGSSNWSLSTWRSRLEPTAQSVQVNYKNPNASISSYAGSYSTFMNEARKQTNGYYRSFYTAGGAINYIRDAFNKSSSPSTEPPPPPVSSGAPMVTEKMATSTYAKYKFSEDVSRSLSGGDLIIRNTSSGHVVGESHMRVSYNSSTNEATWTWPTYNGGKLWSGKWEFKLPDQNVTDSDGNRLGNGGDIVFYITV